CNRRLIICWRSASFKILGFRFSNEWRKKNACSGKYNSNLKSKCQTLQSWSCRHLASLDTRNHRLLNPSALGQRMLRKPQLFTTLGKRKREIHFFTDLLVSFGELFVQHLFF